MRDPEFFLHRYAPVTTAFSLVDIAYDDVVVHWVDWLKSLERMGGWDAPIENVNCKLTEKLELLLPLDGQKRLLTETADGRVAFLVNMPHGDGSSDAAHMATVFKRVRVSVTLVKDGKTGTLTRIGATHFLWEDYGNNRSQKPGGQKRRHLGAHKESRWEWYEGGDPFPWEEFETYKEKRIKHRLTPEMVERYCGHLGIDLFDPDYYAGRATLITLRPTSMLVNYDPGRAYPQFYPNLE